MEKMNFFKKYWTLGGKKINKREQKKRFRPQDEMLSKINRKGEAEEDGALKLAGSD